MRIPVLAAALACAVFVGCGSDSSSNTPPPTPPSDPSIAVTSPADGTTVQGAPIQIGINAKNLSDPSKLTILLNGVNVTAQFPKPGTAGNTTAKFDQPAVQYGKNQIQVRYDTLTTEADFLLDTLKGTDPTAPGSPINGSGQLLPIQTRVLASADADPSIPKNWGIQVGLPGTTGYHYYASNTPMDENGSDCSQSCYGFQILLLSRVDLSQVSNNSYEIDHDEELQPDSPFLKALEAAGNGPNDPSGEGFSTQPAPTGCVPYGCIMVMQSLAAPGYNYCYSSAPSFQGVCHAPFDNSIAVVLDSAENLIYWLTKIGASADVLFANGSNPHVGYSYIGNVGSGRMPGQGTTVTELGLGSHNFVIQSAGNNGSQFDRLGCSDTSVACDNLGSASSSNSDPVGPPGQLTGVLIWDNNDMFTFSQNAPPITYTFGRTQDNLSQTSLTINGWLNYNMSMPSGSGGGFWLLILNRTTPDWQDGKILSNYYNLDPASLGRLASDIGNNANSNDLFFLASMGNITHDAEDANIAPAWEKLVQAVQTIGADPLTFRILGEHHQGHPAFNADGKDDYLLVGRPIGNAPPVFENFTAGMPSHFTAVESGYVFARQTQASPTWPTQVAGVLKRDRQGYYTPTLQTAITNSNQFIQPLEVAMANASLLNPVPWPLSTAQEIAAYSSISNQLCCNDIRKTYFNSDTPPSTLYDLSTAKYPSTPVSFTEEDFNNVIAQLRTEFEYVAAAQGHYAGLKQLKTASEVNVSSILLEAQNAVNADILKGSYVSPQGGAWFIIANDVLPNLGNVAGLLPDFGAETRATIGTATTVLNDTVNRTNDTSGASQLQQALAGEAILATNLNVIQTNQFDDSMSTLANDYKRWVSDWGRLSAIAVPYKTNQFTWDDTAVGQYMKVLDLSARRRYYTAMMAGNSEFFVTHIAQADDEYVGRNNSECQFEYYYRAQDANYIGSSGIIADYSLMLGTAWYPGTIDSQNTNYWDVWAIGEGPDTNDHCPLPFPTSKNLPSTYGMFLPVNNIDIGSINNLGLWRPYVFEYGGFKTYTH